MPHTTTFAIPTYHGERLRALAALRGKTAGSILAELIDDACVSAGLDVTSDAVSVHPWRDGFVVELFGGAYRVERSRAGVEALAHDLKSVADRSGYVLSLDHDHEIMRQGSAVVLKLRAIDKTHGNLGGNEIDLHKPMSPDVAREIARGLLTGLPALAAA